MKELAAAALAQQVGYLRIEGMPDSAILDTLPTRSFNPHRIIRGKDEMFLVIHGLVEIWHTHYDKLVKTLEQGALFGELPLVGQSMLGTRAITGTPGATVAVMDEAAALKWAKVEPTLILRMVGSRLARVEAEHYRARFQLMDSRIAALLLELAGESPHPFVVSTPNYFRAEYTKPALQDSAPVESDKPHVMAASYYSLQGNLKSSISLNNKGLLPLEVKPTLFNMDGERLDVPPVIIDATSFQIFDLAEWASLGGPTFQQGSLQLFYRGKDLLLGAQVKITDSASSIIFDDSFPSLKP